MITCKICESDILKEKLGEHSVKCKEVAELKEGLVQFVNKMEKYAEKASIIKNSLEIYAAKHKKLHKKFSGSNSTLADPGSPCSPGHSLSFLIRCDTTEIDTQLSEDDKICETPKKSSHESYGPVKKMTEEEYEKFLKEAKKSLFALKKIMAYASKINTFTYENELEFDVKSELEVVYADILDTKISAFLENFMTDLTKYMDLKKQYIKEAEKLAGVSCEGHYKHIKQQFQAQKSMSVKQKRGLNLKGSKMTSRFKEDAPDEIAQDSPANPARKIPNKPSIDFASPSMEKRDQSTQQLNLFSLMTPKIMSNSGSVSNIGQGLLQNNSNHMANKSLFSAMKSNRGGGGGLDALREKLNALAHIQTRETKEAPKKEETEHQTNKAKYKESMKNRKQRYTATNMNEIVKEDSPDKKIGRRESQLVAWNKGEGRQDPRKAPTVHTKKRRTSSMDLYRSLHKDEDEKNHQRFPSLLDRDFEDGDKKEIEFNSMKQISRKTSEDSPNIWESPAMKGYYSDTCARSKKRSDLGADYPQVSVEDFEPIRFIGKGAYGTVWLVRKKATGDEYAMKIVDWANRGSQNRMSALKLEKDIYKMLEGDYVVKAVWTFHYENFICFVTEYMIGGDFNKLLDDLVRLDEDQARFYFAELVLAVESLHNLGIVHRDLKPDNILMDAKGHIRLTDFGLSETGLNKLKGNTTPIDTKENTSSLALKKKASIFEQWNEEVGGESKEGQIGFKTKKNEETIFDFLKDEHGYTARFERRKTRMLSMKDAKRSMVGTPDYMAPEIIDSEKMIPNYNEKCMDWWSMGIILYQFLVGVPPFCDDTVEKVFSNILNYQIQWPDIGYGEDCISPQAVDLIKKLLEPNPSKRLGANGAYEIKNHPFFKGFNWDGVRERQGLIIPCVMEQIAPITMSAEDLKEESVKAKFPLSDPSSIRTGPAKRKLKQIDIDGFQMRRLDVLDKLNQETFKKLQTQDVTNKNVPKK